MKHLPLSAARRARAFASGAIQRVAVVVISTLVLSSLLLFQQTHAPAHRVSPLEAAELGIPDVLDRLSPDQANATSDLGEPLLVLAARCGRLASVQSLLDRGADPDHPGPLGTPLMEAARAGHTRLVQLLLAHGASPNYHTQNGNDALQDSLRNEHYDCAAILLAAGANPNPQNPLNSPLSLCPHHPTLTPLLQRSTSPLTPAQSPSPLSPATAER